MAIRYFCIALLACIVLIGSSNANSTAATETPSATTEHNHMPTGHHHMTTKHHHHMTTGHHHHMSTGHHHHMSTEHNHGGGGDSGGHMMAMYFYAGLDFYVLFADWFVSSTEALVGSCLGVGICAVLYEGLKELRVVLTKRNRRKIPPAKTSSVGNMKVIETVTSDQSESCLRRMFSCCHLLQSFLHLIQVTVSYALMLIVMTYNVWLFLSVVLGLFVGHFLFAWNRSTSIDINEHCA